MRDFTDKCVVLKVSDYRDDDKLIKVLTAENGMQSVLLRGVKKAKAKLKPFAQPFACFDTRLVSGKGAFLTPVEPMLIADGFGLCSDLKVFTAASVAAEATVLAIADDEPHATASFWSSSARCCSAIRITKRRYICLSCSNIRAFTDGLTATASRSPPCRCWGTRKKRGTSKARTETCPDAR